jgi:hypothetical protein
LGGVTEEWADPSQRHEKSGKTGARIHAKSGLRCEHWGPYLTIRFDGVSLPLSAKLFFVLWSGLTLAGMFMSWYKPYFFGPTQGTGPNLRSQIATSSLVSWKLRFAEIVDQK